MRVKIGVIGSSSYPSKPTSYYFPLRALSVLVRVPGSSESLSVMVFSGPPPKWNNTSLFDNIWGGEDDWVGCLPHRFKGWGRNPLGTNRDFWLELIGRFRGRRWQNSLPGPVSGLGSFLQSLLGLEKGMIRYLCLGYLSEFGEQGSWSPKHDFKVSKPLLIRSTSGQNRAKEWRSLT